MKRLCIGLIGIVMVLALTVATGCAADPNTSAKSDETVCVFDGSDRGSQKLKYQIFPGQEPKNSDDDDEVVRIPTSFRFYAAFEDRTIADAGAPTWYVGYARGNTPVKVQGSFKFRFNVDNACEWYARHGRRNASNGNLGFNARSNEAASDFSPWVRWLNENFGVAGAATIKHNTIGYTWPELTYGNDEQAPQRGEPVDINYGKHIGRIFTNRLSNSLGGKFFCGTDASLWGQGSVDDACPPIFFETGPIHPENVELEAQRETTEALRAQLENDRLQAEIRARQLKTQKQDERTKQELLLLQIRTAKLEALSTAAVQTCLIYAKQGLDCQGKRPNQIITGN